MPTVFGFGLSIEVNTASVKSSDPSAYMWHMVRCACLAGSGLNTVLEDASLPSLFLKKQSCKTPESFRESHGVQAGILFPYDGRVPCWVAGSWPHPCACVHSQSCCFGSKAGYSIPEVSCLDGGLRWSRFPTVHIAALLTAGHCPYHTALLQLPRLFQAPFFPAVCLQRWIYIHIPCIHNLAFLRVKSRSLWQ